MIARARQLLLALPAAMMLLVLGACGHQDDAVAQTAPAPQPVILPALPRPDGPLAKNATCITAQCHATYQRASHIHGPVSQGACSSCHAEDQGGHKYPVTRKGNEICSFCHNVSGSKAHQHKALEPSAAADGKAAGGCMSCHDPHVSKAKFLLTADTVEAVCIKCHTLQLKKHAHEPFAAGQCTVCHQAHQSENKSLLRYGEGPQHCFGCHTEKQKQFATMTVLHKPSAQDCGTCHGPHATDNAKQMKKPVNDTCLACHDKIKAELAAAKQVHGAVTQGNCASCHDPHGSNQPAVLKARTDKLCMSCHEKAVKAADGKTIPGMGIVMASKNLHGPVKSGSCSECHKPHAADQPNLLKKYFPDTFYAKFDLKNYELCFTCHDQQMVLKDKSTVTGFRDGEKNLHFIHVNRDEKGRTCKTCHDMHGSDLPKHMAASVPFEGGRWSMPITYEPKSDGGTCASACHEEKTYRRTPGAERGAP